MTNTITKTKMNFATMSDLNWEKTNIKRLYNIIDEDENADLTPVFMTNKRGNISVKFQNNKTDKGYVVGRLPEDVQAKVRRMKSATLHVVSMLLNPETGECEMMLKIGKSTDTSDRQVKLAL